jgi:hypothetical protein
MALGAIGCWIVFALASLLVGGAVIFRVAVTLSNKCLGASPVAELDHDDNEIDEWIGYRRVRRQTQAIPEPGVGKGMVSVLLLFVVGILADFLMRFLFGVSPFDPVGFEDDDLVIFSHLMGLVICFPLSAWILASILPTKFDRACLVLLWNYMIVLLIVGGGAVIINALF